MSARVFVGNLKFTVSDDNLREAFASVGQVLRAEIVRDRYDGHSRGFAFVEMASEGEVETALRELGGKRLAGRPMRVEAAIAERPKSKRSRANRKSIGPRLVGNSAAERFQLGAHE